MSHLLWYPGYELLLPDIVRAEDCCVFDTAGRKYLDLESGVWCTPLGHGHPRVLRALGGQSARISHTGYNYSLPVVEEAALEVLGLLGFPDGRCVFLCSGSEAVEYGVRAAQAVSERPLLMTMTDSYFGAYGSASRRQEGEWFSFDWLGCADCPDSRNCDGACPRWASIPREKIGGFLFEPGSSSGLVRFPPVKLIRAIAGFLRESGGLFLVNEVTTGIGRTGKWFGHQHYDISPDVVALGKGVGNGYPVAVAAFAPGVAARLGGPIKYAQSHQNDPLGAAIALEVLRTIREENLIEHGLEVGEFLVAGLEAVQERTGLIRAVRSRGLMVAVELVDDAEVSRTIRVHRELVRRGFLVGRRPGLPVFRIDPPLTIEFRDIETFLTAFEDVLRAVGPGPDGSGGVGPARRDPEEAP